MPRGCLPPGSPQVGKNGLKHIFVIMSAGGIKTRGGPPLISGFRVSGLS